MENKYDADQMLAYVKMAEELGCRVTSPQEVRSLVNAIRYCELRFADPHNTDSIIAEKLGVTPVTIAIWKRKDMITVASQIVLATFLLEGTRDDTRRMLFSTMQKYLPRVVDNMMRIAAGDPDPVTKNRPLPKDQIAAYTAIATTPIGTAFVQNLFIGPSSGDSESAHLQLREKLSTRTAAINLDEVMEAEIVNVTRRDAKDSQLLLEGKVGEAGT